MSGQRDEPTVSFTFEAHADGEVISHDMSMPHDMRYWPEVEGCPPYCPVRIHQERSSEG